MIKDENISAIQIVGARDYPHPAVTAMTGASNRVDLIRNRCYRMLANHDVYFMQGAEADAAVFAPPNTCEYLPGGQFLYFSAEDFEYLYLQAVATDNTLVWICEVG